ncbi:transposase [Nitrosomonas halophila]|uniref:transposase n=1 Tax=Nitrosomonas halophila TaxID=44576 RepID=UPI001C409A96
MPREFPAWCSVYYYFHRWSHDGTWERLHHLLRSRLREKCGRHKQPTAGCLDSQSVKCSAVPGQRGFDAGKKINGRKRHILVDILGLLLTVVVTVPVYRTVTVLACCSVICRAGAKD